MPASERLEELASALDTLAESLADVAMDVLREAISQATESSGEQARKQEKIINRARSSVEKAARLARQATGSPSEEPDSSEADF